MKNEDLFSENFVKANAKIESFREDYKNAKTQLEKDKLELIALLENNMDIFKNEFYGVSNFEKKDRLFRYINENFYKVNKNLLKDKQINRYLFKHGFFDAYVYAIISACIIASTSFFIMVCTLLMGFVTFNSVTALIWFIATFAVTLLFDLTEHYNFYRVKK